MYICDHLKRFEVLAIISKALLKLGSLFVGHIHFISLLVIFRNRSNFKEPGMIDISDVILRAVHYRSVDALYLSCNYLSLGRIVVHKHQGFRQKIKLSRNCLKVLALRLPVCFYGNKIIRFKCSIRMLKPCHGIFFLVLGINSKDNTKLLLLPYIVLKLKEYLAKIGLLTDLNAIYSVISDNSAPEGIVKVKHKSLLILAIYGFDDISHIEAQSRNCLNRKSILIHMPGKWIGPLIKAVTSCLIIDIIDKKACALSFCISCIFSKKLI